MRVLSLIGFLAVVSLALAGEKVQLVRQYRTGEEDTYSVVAKVASSDFHARATVRVIVGETKEAGKASGVLKMLNLQMDTGGGLEDRPTAEALKVSFDRKGMPDILIAKDATVPFAILTVASYVPGGEVEVGSRFDVSWEGKNGARMTGKGTLVEIKEQDGAKVAVVKYELEALPEDEQDPGTLVLNSIFDLSTGKLIKCTGTLDVDGSSGTVEVARLVQKG